MSDDVLFCPFCGESFEGEARCPEHDLPLVDMAELGRLRAAQGPDEDQPLAPYDMRFGRGPLLAATIVLVAAFFLPFLELRLDGRIVQVSALEQAAGSRAINLWIVPLVGLGWFLLAFRRRTLRTLRGGRLAAVATGLLGLSSLGYTLWTVTRAVDQQAAGRDVGLSLASGSYVMGAALVLGTALSLRLGRHAPKPPSYRVE